MAILRKTKNIVLSALRAVTSNYVYSMNYGNVSIKRRGGLDFLRKIIRLDDPEADFLTSLDFKGKIIYDIGGYIGILTIVFSKLTGKTGQVVVFEPYKENCLKIKDNIRLNRLENVRIVEVAIGDKKDENAILIMSRSSSATGSFDKQIQSQIIVEGNYRQLQSRIDTLDNTVVDFSLPYPDFIKIDIEGMEFFALLGMCEIISRKSPEIYIEIHGTDESSKCENIRRITQLFQSIGYSIWHIETKQYITLANCETAKSGHILCRKL